MKPFTTVTVAFLVLVALLQLARFISGWEVTVNGIGIPIWLSGIASVVVTALAVMLWRETRG